jgi:glycosyltransferase involved in cell wall biosynthesis
MIAAMREKLKSLSVFFPAYNEAANLPTLLAEAEKIFPQYAKKYELLVIDDGSSDTTAKVLATLQKKYPHLRVLHHQSNRGYGECLKTGIKAAQYEWIFWTDADLQFHLAEFSEFAQAAQQQPLIIGYRLQRAEGKSRQVLVSVLKFGVDLLFRLHVRDIDCAFKLIRSDLLKNLRLQSGSAFTTSEILYLLKKKKYTIYELPVHHYPRRYGEASGAQPRVLLKAFFDALRVYSRSKWRSLKGK